jgi:2-methylcitrate dehydratase PrpD
LKASCPEAAWANGILGHSLDFDDNSIGLPAAIHQTVTTLPAALSLGELVNASGREMLLAIVLGIEAGSKVDRAMEGHASSWHGTGTFGTFASTVTAGRLLRLEPAELEHALGMAASMAAGLEVNFGTMTKPLHAGQASRNGVIAALLAKKGFTSAKGILEKKDGFGEVLGRRLNPDYLGEYLANPWEIVEPGIHLKNYPSCMVTHSALDAILGMARTYQLDARSIESVEVLSKRDLRRFLIYDEQKTASEGKFSMQFCVAVGLLERKVTLEEFTDEKMRDPEIIKLMKNVRLQTDPNLPDKSMLTTLVRVTMNDHRTYEKMVEYPKGSKMNPMSVEEVAEKFRTCAKYDLQKTSVDKLIEAAFNLEELENVNELTSLLVP